MDTIDGVAAEGREASATVSADEGSVEVQPNGFRTSLRTAGVTIVRGAAGCVAVGALSIAWRAGLLPSELFLLVGLVVCGVLVIVSRLLFSKDQYPIDRLIRVLVTVLTSRPDA